MKLHTTLYIVCAAALLIGLFFLLKPQSHKSAVSNTYSPSSEKNQATPQVTQVRNTIQSDKKTFNIIIRNKEIVSGQKTISVNQGDEVDLRITADEQEEFHLHAYDKIVKLEPNKTASLTFKADKSGRFSFELETSHAELGALEVYPAE